MSSENKSLSLVATKIINNACILHQGKDTNCIDKLRGFTENALSKVKNASQIRQDFKIISVLTDTCPTTLMFHQRCYDKYVHIKTISNIQHKQGRAETAHDSVCVVDKFTSERRTSTRKRDRSGKIIADKECCICYRKKTNKDRNGYEALTKCVTENAAKTLKENALCKSDIPRLMASVSGAEWQSIISLELHYHRSCYVNYTRPLRNPSVITENTIMSLLFDYVREHILNNLEIIETSKLIEFYSENCTDREKIPDSRTLQDSVVAQFKGSVQLWSPKYGYSFLYNNTIEKGKIIEVLLKKIERLEKKNNPKPIEQLIDQVAQEIRNEVLSMEKTYFDWPPNEDELLRVKTKIPPLLRRLFAKVLFCARVSNKGLVKITSLCEDVIYNITNGNHRCSKHVLLGLSTKRKTGSKELIKWLNKLGHGISYDEVNYLETTLAQNAIQNQNLKSFCPSVLQPSRFVTFVWDNNDINPETLNGTSMHVTNGIVIQLQNQVDQVHKDRVNEKVTRDRERSFKAIENQLPLYVKHNREEPDHLRHSNAISRDTKLLEVSEKLDFFWTLLYYFSDHIPSWTGFNYLITPKKTPEDIHTISYLPAINSSPTNLNTVLEVLLHSKAKAENLGLTETDVVVDQAIYAKAVEILMNPSYIDLKRFIVLRMGVFHISCIFLTVIGKRFSDAGLQDWIIEAELCGKSSVDRILKGKHYNRAVRIYKYLYNALTQLRIKHFESWLIENNLSSLNHFASSPEIINCLKETNYDNLKLLFDDDFCKAVDDHSNVLKDIKISGPTSAFWFSFIEMLNIFFALLRSTKVGNWNLHLEATRQMIPWFFAYDHPNYSRYLTFYWTEMTQLPKTHPSVYQQFMDGNFSVRRTSGTFNKIPSDQCIEQTINRDQKCRGGIKGYSTCEGTIQRWILTSHTVSKCISILQNNLGITTRKQSPKDLKPSRKDFNNGCVERALMLMKNWGSPFKQRDSLVNICSGIEAPDELEEHLLNAQSIGETEFQKFFKERIQSSTVSFYAPIKMCRLQTFKNLNLKKIYHVKEKSYTITSERSMFGRLLVIAKSREGLTLKQILCYSLSPIPWALGLPDGSFVKTNKMNLLCAIESSVDREHFEEFVSQVPQNAAHVFDGMAILQQLANIKLKTFGDISEFILNLILKGSTIYFVTDQYQPGSIKSFERARRKKSGSLHFKIQRREQARPNQWQKYMQDADNKVDLITFLLNDWSHTEMFALKLTGYILFVNLQSRFYKLTCEVGGQVTSEEVESLHTNQEEADTKVFLCSKHAASIGFDSVCIHTVDTDIAIYGLYFQNQLPIHFFVDIGVCNSRRILDIKIIASKLGTDCCKALLALHAFSGNDYTSAFYGIGKAKFFKLMRESEEYKSIFSKIGDTFTFDATHFEYIEKFTCQLYGLKCNNTNEGRYIKFIAKKEAPEPQKLPPTRDSLMCHCKRVSYVTAVVKRSLEANPDIPKPNGHGWKEIGNQLEVEWMLIPPAPEDVLQLISCACKKSKCETRVCICRLHGLSCTELCGCSYCENKNDSYDSLTEYSSSDSDASSEFSEIE
ncbi:uncharacterized protein LOC124811086 [Hydra vulgaris]|uniref:uncharacterized protein LOC124811086 n=1 Tax=Hydra vulgaris TaxID=6087 RepID=UPI001F5F8693|nr:uncharacterized protein LOC124811086 [Hydra vulgaris]